MNNEKYILEDEDIRSLSQDQWKEYTTFLNNVEREGRIYRNQLEKFCKILQSQYEKGVLFNPNSLQRFPLILSKNFKLILEKITQYRNNIIFNYNGSFNKFHFEGIVEGLQDLIEFSKIYSSGYYWGNSLGKSELEALIPEIEELKTQIEKDLKYFESYSKEKTSAIAEYRYQKEIYDKLSLFGKIKAKLNGTKAKLEEAAKKSNYYNSLSINPDNLESLSNPYQYEEYMSKMEEREGKTL